MIEPNIDRKWNEGAGYHWTRDNEGRPLAITASDYKEAIANAQRNPEDARAYLGRCRRHGHCTAALYLLVGFTLGALLMLALSHIGRPV